MENQPVNKKPKIAVDEVDVVPFLLDLVANHGTVAQTLWPYLCINDLTRIGMTCRDMQRMVALERSSPSIVWEKRFAATIGFDTIDEDINLVQVLQSQNFCFSVQDNESDAEKSIQVEFSVENAIWHEQNNMRDGPSCPDLSIFPKPSRMRLAIIAPKKSYQMRARVFIAHPDHWEPFGASGPWQWFFVGEDHNYVESDQNWSPQDKKLLRRAIKYAYLCAKRVANFPDGTTYPSAEYLLRLLPEWLHPYFPDTFDWNAPHQDRTTKVEFSYRPARSIAEWREFAPPDSDGIYSYTPDEIPWYRPDYSWFSDSDSDNGH